MELTVGAMATPDERDALVEDIDAGAPPASADPVAPPALDLPTEGGTIARTRFAHASEAEMARILDFYAVRWEYEPTTFPILWNLDGDVVESFAPDFYLPDIDLFLEMTTLKQRLVRKKNRKLRRLRELYPDIKIKLFYARDFRAMMLKYGRLGLAHSLSGTLGQVPSERAHIVPPIAAVEIGADLAADLAGEPAVDGRTAPAVAIGAVAMAREQVADAGGDAPTPAVHADRDLVPQDARATSRPRPGRRRRRSRKAIEAGAEREAGT